MKANACSGNCNQGRLLCNCNPKTEIDNTSIAIMVLINLVALVAIVIAVS